MRQPIVVTHRHLLSVNCFARKVLTNDGAALDEDAFGVIPSGENVHG